MKKILIIVLIIIFVIALGIFLFVFLRRRKKNKLISGINDLEYKKNELEGLPVLTELGKIEEIAKSEQLEEKISEIQTIDKAKFMLMQYKGMTEEEAHSYLEQYAMNKRKKKSKE